MTQEPRSGGRVMAQGVLLQREKGCGTSHVTARSREKRRDREGDLCPGREELKLEKVLVWIFKQVTEREETLRLEGGGGGHLVLKKGEKEKEGTQGEDKVCLSLCLKQCSGVFADGSLLPPPLGEESRLLCPTSWHLPETPREPFHAEEDQKGSKLKQVEKEPAWDSGLEEPARSLLVA